MLTFQAAGSISGARCAASLQAPSSAEPLHRTLQPAPRGQLCRLLLFQTFLLPLTAVTPGAKETETPVCDSRFAKNLAVTAQPLAGKSFSPLCTPASTAGAVPALGRRTNSPFFNHKTRQAEPQGVLFAPCKMPSPHLRCFIPRATPAGTAPGPALDCPNLPSSACPRRGRLEEATCPRINQPNWFPDVLSRWNLALRTGDTFATWKQQSIP